MPARALLVLVLTMAFAVPAGAAGGRVRAQQCKRSCGAVIAACGDETGRLRRCKRQVLRRCRREGPAICAPAETYFVATSGTDAAGCGNPEMPCRTIQYAVDERIPRDGAGVVKLATGVYDGVHDCPPNAPSVPAVVCVVNKRVTLLGGFQPPSWDDTLADPGLTVIDAAGVGRGVHVVRGAEVGPATSFAAERITIRNGRAVSPATGPLDERSAFGGGLYAQHSAITLRDVVFRDNEAFGGVSSASEGGRAAGGALAVYSGWASVPAPAVLENVTFEANRALGGSGVDMGGYALGGAMFTHSVAVTGNGIVFAGNTAIAGPTAGAGTNGTEKGDALGGALAVGIDGMVDLRNVRAVANVATGSAVPNGDAGGAFGGALYVEKGALMLSSAHLEGNRAEGGDGQNSGLGGSIAQGGAIQVLHSDLTIDRTTIVGNEARAGDGVVNGGVADGGGVAVILGEFAGAPRTFVMRNAIVSDNDVTHGAGRVAVGAGGGVFVNGATATIVHSTIADNRIGDPNDVGGGIAGLPVPGFQTHVDVLDSIIANHRTPGIHPRGHANAGLWMAAGTSAGMVRVLFANNLHDSNAGIDDPYNLPPGTFTQSDVATAASAGFVGPADYRLGPGSPAVDAAVGSDVTIDVDGNARPAGRAPDLGAHERIP